MAIRKTTIGDSPLDAVIPNPLDLTETTSRGSEKPKVVKERLTVHLSVELIDRVKNAVYWTPGLTLAGLTEEGLTEAVDALEKSRGGPYPSRKENLKGGRPIK